MFFLFLPVIAVCALFLATCLKRKIPVFAVGFVCLAGAFARMGAMSLRNVFQGKIYTRKILPFLTLNGVEYEWGFSFTRAELVLTSFILFIALLSLVFAKSYLQPEKINRFTMFLCALAFCVLTCIGSDNFFQFFAGWELSVLFAYLLLLLFFERQSVRQAGNRFFVCHVLSDIPLFYAFYILMSKTGCFFVPPFIPVDSVAFSAEQAMTFGILVLIGLSVKLMLFASPLPLTETAEMCVPVLAFAAPVALGGLGIYALYNAYAFFEGFKAVRTVLCAVGALTAAAGIVSALCRDDFKNVLTGMLSSQFGLVLTVFGLAGRDAGFCAYIALMLPMSGLILAAGTIIYALRAQENITRMGGLSARLPALFWIMGLLSLCCVGFPAIGTFGVWQDLYAALYVKGNFGFASGFAVLSFGLAWAFARMLYNVFFAPRKMMLSAVDELRPVGAGLLVPVSIVLIAALCQEKIFEQSVLDDLSRSKALAVLALSLVGCSGLCFGLLYFKRRKHEQPFGKAGETLVRLLSFAPVYRVVIVRPCLAVARGLWYSVGTELWLEKFPRAVQNLAQNIQKRQNGQVSAFFTAVLIGLFLLVAAAIGMKG